MDLLRTIPASEDRRWVRRGFALPLPVVPRHVSRLLRVVLKHDQYLHVRGVQAIVVYPRTKRVRVGEKVRGWIKARCEILLGPAQRPVKSAIIGFTGIRYGRLAPNGRWHQRRR
jgi:hypothetical protein